MFKKNKRLLSVILTLCMVVSMFLGNTITTNATELNTDATLENLVITGFPEVKAGEVMVTEASLGIEGLPDDNGVKVYVEWEDEEGTITTGTEMKEGHVYTAMIQVAILYDPYTFSDNFVLIIDGNEHTPAKIDEYNQQLELEYDLSNDSNAEKTILESVTVTGLTSIIEVGASIANTKATFDAPEGCITDSHWYKWDADANDWLEVSNGTFTATDIYYFCITFQADDGYEFSEDFEVILPEGFEGSVWSEEDDNEITYHYDMPISTFANAIYKIVVTSPEVKVGAEASTDKIDVTFYTGDEIITDSNFEISSRWICTTQEYTDVTGKVFEEGQTYQLEMDINALPGYYFAETLVIEHNGHINDFAYDNPTHAELFYNYSLAAPLEKVEISSIPTAKAGEIMVSADSLSIKNLPDDVEVLVYWWDEDGNDTEGAVMETGHVYTLQLEVYASGNTPLSEDFVFVINGTEYKPTEIDENNIQPCQAWLELEYNLSGAKNNVDTSDNNNSDNTNSNDNKASNTVKTGDSSMILLWTVLAVVSMGTIVVIRRKKA